MAFENHYGNFLKFKSLRQYEEAEKHLSSALKEVFTRKDQSLCVQCLWNLGTLYTEYGKTKKDSEYFTKAVAFFNAALRRVDRERDSSNMYDKLWTSVKEAEIAFTTAILQECRGGYFNNKETDLLQRKILSDIRKRVNDVIVKIDEKSDHKTLQLNNSECDDAKRISSEMMRFEQVSSMSTFISSQITKFLKTLISECTEYIGEPPCKYSILGLGSLAKREMTPYSDLEFAILTEKNDPKARQYFRNLTDMLHIKILNLGETVLPSMYIKSLNDFESPDPNDNWFYDHVTPKGLSFDGAMPWACKTPKGRKPTESKPWQTELIQTPSDMASFQQEGFLLKEGYKLSDVLRSVCLITGDEDLLADYLRRVKMILSMKSVDLPRRAQSAHLPRRAHSAQLTNGQTRALLSLREDYDKYNMESDIFKEGTLHNVKNQLYRFCSTVIQSLGLYFNIASPQTADIIDALYADGIISPESKHNVLVMSAISYEMRVRTYIKQCRQKEGVSVCPPLCYDAGHNDDVFIAENYEMMFRFYQSAIPLCETLRKIVSGEISVMEGLRSVDLYDRSWHTKGVIYHRLFKLQEARLCFERALEECPTNFESHHMLANTLYAQTHYNDAYMCICKASELFKHESLQTEDLWYLYHTMGTSLSAMGPEKSDDALCYLKKALQIKSEIFGIDGDLVNSTTLITIAHVYSERGDLTMSDEYYMRALKALEVIEGDLTSSEEAAIIYNNLGTNAFNRHQFDEAAAYHEKSLATRKRVFGNVCHPSIAVNVDSLGTIYTALEQYQKAMPFLKEYLHMRGPGDEDDPKGVIYKLSNSGVVLMKQNCEYEVALQMFEEALRIHGSTGTEDYIGAVILNNIGYASYKLGLYQKAEQFYEKALAEIEKFSPDKDHSDMYENKACFSQNLGVLFLTQGKYKESLSQLELTRRIRSEANSAKVVSVTETYIARVIYFMEERLIGECVDMCEKAKAQHWSVHGDQMTWDHITVANNLGQLHSESGNHKRATECHEEAIRICSDIYETETHCDYAESFYLLGKAWLDGGNQEKAVPCLKDALSIWRKIFGHTSKHANVMETLRTLRNVSK